MTRRRELSVLYLTKYEQLGASSRYRFFQYFPALEAAGIRCCAAPLLSDAYLENRYARGRGRAVDYLGALCRRLAALCGAARYDLVVIEKELFPYFPALVERVLAKLGVRYAVEYDDALFHQYDQSPSRLVRRLLGGKIAAVMRHSRLVIAGNRYLADYARRAGAPRVEVLPTVVDLERYPAVAPAGNACFTIGWIGSPTTSVYLAGIAQALAEVCRGGRARVVLIGSGPVQLPGVPVEIVPWNEATEVAQLCSLDAGIMPLPQTPWALGKCGFKLVQYMACGLPVLASPVGANRDIVDEGVNGFTACDNGQWTRALQRLIDDRELGRRMGRSGRRKVEGEYCLQVVAPRLVELLRDLAGEGA